MARRRPLPVQVRRGAPSRPALRYAFHTWILDRFFFGCSLSDTGSEKIDRTVTKSLLSVQRNVLVVD